MFYQNNRSVKVIAIILFFSFPTTFVFAEETTDLEVTAYEKYTQAIGFQYGEISGWGLSYQAWMNKIGLQVTAGIIYNPDANDWQTELNYSVGLEMQFRVYGDDFSKWLSGQLYLFTGINHGGFIENEYDWEFPGDDGKYIPLISGGIGFGIELILFQHFSIPFGVGYGLIWEGRDRAFVRQISVKLCPEVGIRYRY